MDNIAAASEQARQGIASLTVVADTIRDRNDDINQIITNVEQVTASVEPEKIRTTVDNVVAASEQARQGIAALATVADTIGNRNDDINRIITNVEEVTASVDPQKIRTTVDNVTAASEQARQGIASLANVANTIGNRNSDINQIITNVDQLSARLNEAALKVQTTLDKIDGFIGSGNTDGLVAEARKTLQTIQQIANTINKHIGPIADNIQRVHRLGFARLRRPGGRSTPIHLAGGAYDHPDRATSRRVSFLVHPARLRSTTDVSGVDIVSWPAQGWCQALRGRGSCDIRDR